MRCCMHATLTSSSTRCRSPLKSGSARMFGPRRKFARKRGVHTSRLRSKERDRDKDKGRRLGQVRV